MWQIQALMALDLAREKAEEAAAWRRAAQFQSDRPSAIRRFTAATLRGLHGLAAGVATSADSLAERVEHPAI